MNPLTWQNPEQLFVAQVLKIFYNSVAELRINSLFAISIGSFFEPVNCIFAVRDLLFLAAGL